MPFEDRRYKRKTSSTNGTPSKTWTTNAKPTGDWRQAANRRYQAACCRKPTLGHRRRRSPVPNYALGQHSLLPGARLPGCPSAWLLGCLVVWWVPKWKTSRLTVVTIGRLQFNVQVAVYALEKRIESIVSGFYCCCSFHPYHSPCVRFALLLLSFLAFLLHIISFVVIIFVILLLVISLHKEILLSAHICVKNLRIAVDAVAVGDDDDRNAISRTTY